MKKFLFFNLFMFHLLFVLRAQDNNESKPLQISAGYYMIDISNATNPWKGLQLGINWNHNSLSGSYLIGNSFKVNNAGVSKGRSGYSLSYSFVKDVGKKLDFLLCYKSDYIIIKDYHETSFRTDQYNSFSLFYYDIYKYLNNSLGLGLIYNFTDYVDFYVKLYAGIALPHYIYGMKSDDLKDYEYEFKSKLGVRKEFIQSSCIGIDLNLNQSFFRLFKDF